jgi:simple sugar transport system ATP-binding protein
MGTYEKAEVTREELTQMMAGGAELDALSHELERDSATSGDERLQAVAEELKSGSEVDE